MPLVRDDVGGPRRTFQKYIIGGVPISFPFEIIMMEKIVRSIKESQNALLESPTGTGKTITLLSAVLAWREAEKARIKAASAELLRRREQHIKSAEAAAKAAKESAQAAAAAEMKSPFFNKQPGDGAEAPSRAIPPDEPPEQGSVHIHKSDKGLRVDFEGLADDAVEAIATSRIPRIFIASRTQKQVQQTIRELREKTPYRPKISTLASREHYCINPAVRRTGSINEECMARLDAEDCVHFLRVRNLQGQVESLVHTQSGIWDIEDLVSMGKRTKGCPYYAARAIAETADVIFAPYNYIIDPLVRAASSVDLKDSIVIIDEAHNTESVCAEAGSIHLTEGDLKDATRDLEAAAADGQNEIEIKTIVHLLKCLMEWRTNYRDNFTIREFNRSMRIWAGSEIGKLLAEMGILAGNISVVTHAYKAISAANAAADRHGMVAMHILSNRTLATIGSIVMVLGFIFAPGESYMDDYRMVLSKTENERPRDGDPPWVYAFSFWCLNPAVIFREIASLTRSVILTSGTLSPLQSFSSELGTKFSQVLEAPHVIKDDQICIGVLPSGANEMLMSGTFKNFETYDYQDQLGLSIARLARLIPNGLLVFLPSYSWLDKLTKRWGQTGLMRRLAESKQIFIEPRGNAKKELEKLIADYDSASQQERGAMLLCVHRGKMSEGIDFADHRARGVICVGLPFPNIKDLQVLQKRDYNTAKASSRGLLNGSEWYEIQAFRALNQALGRCIRHRGDWGAIVLLDHRFTFTKSVNSLSKWIRQRTRQWQNLREAETTLRSFFEYRARVAEEQREQEEKQRQAEEAELAERARKRAEEAEEMRRQRDEKRRTEETLRHAEEAQQQPKRKTPPTLVAPPLAGKGAQAAASASGVARPPADPALVPDIAPEDDTGGNVDQQLRLQAEHNRCASGASDPAPGSGSPQGLASGPAKTHKKTVDMSKFMFSAGAALGHSTRAFGTGLAARSSTDAHVQAAATENEAAFADPAVTPMQIDDPGTLEHVSLEVAEASPDIVTDSLADLVADALAYAEADVEDSDAEVEDGAAAGMGSASGSAMPALACRGCGAAVVVGGAVRKAAAEVAALHFIAEQAVGGDVVAVGDEVELTAECSAAQVRTLNAHWCIRDGLAYALASCTCCGQLVGWVEPVA
ncbi:hypothetical protein HK105_202424 [Polyrhizophydium stewartii]|uniref:DNA 5'-3' helicase n=1 Tax=Polyrhizophydium stewartii TaxID=2732419 RepID=A0ABR4NEQ2_9FUNG